MATSQMLSLLLFLLVSYCGMAGSCNQPLLYKPASPLSPQLKMEGLRLPRVVMLVGQDMRMGAASAVAVAGAYLPPLQ
jgi:hypothetical protein